MAFNFDSKVQDVSYEEIRKAAKWCLAFGRFGQVRTQSGRTVQFDKPQDAIDTIRFCDEQLGYEDTSAPLGMVSVQINDPA